MAKLQLYDTMGSNQALSDLYNEEDMFLVDESETTQKADFLDLDASREITFRGTDFTFNMDDIATGTLKSVDFKTSDDGFYAKLTGLNADAAAMEDTLRAADGIPAMLDKLLKGDDRIFGTNLGDSLIFGIGRGDDVIDGDKGRDVIGGGLGNDRLIGGGQGDYFWFEKGEGKDVIVDFDAVGGGAKQDYIFRTFENFKDIDIVRSGDDTIIDYGHGSTLTLLGVDRRDISAADFVFPN